MSWRPWLLLALCTVLAGACHWIVPYGSGPASPEGAAQDGARRDRPLADRPSFDLFRDRSSPDRPYVRDGARDASKPPDLKPDVTCWPVEQDPIQNKACPVPGCVPADDCDGLPAVRDPDPLCNPVIWSEPFSQTTWPPGWGRSYCDNAHERVTCGVMRFSFPPNQTQAVWTKVPSIQPTDIVETRFYPPPSDWHLELIVSQKQLAIPVGSEPACWSWNLSGPQRWCKVHRVGSTLTLDAAVLVASQQGDTAYATTTTTGWMVLQSYVVGTKHFCRLYAQLTSLVIGADFFPEVLPPGAMVMINAANDDLTKGAQIDVDWVRAFASPPP